MNERGFSLIEVILVVLIMGILTAIAAQKWSGALEQTRFEATRVEMDRLAQAIAGNPELAANDMRTDFGYVGDVGALPGNLDALAANPGLGTWNGPYVQSDFTQNPNDYKQDAWGATYAYSGGVTITSTGSGSDITRQFAGAVSDLTSNTVQGSVTDGLDNAPGDSAGLVEVRISYPDGAGSVTSSTVHPNSGGSYVFSGIIPVGNHTIFAAYDGDTVTRYASVLPRSTAYVNFRLPGDLWSAGGGGSGGGGHLTFVEGSAGSSNMGRDIYFQVVNNTGSTVQITSIEATYLEDHYYEQVIIGGTTVFSSASPRGASGDVKAFSVIGINDGQTVTIQYNVFKQCQTGACDVADRQDKDHTIDFSDGSSVTFTVP